MGSNSKRKAMKMYCSISLTRDMHGESAPAEMDEWIAKGYKVYDVTKYGAIPNDGQPDRELL